MTATTKSVTRLRQQAWFAGTAICIVAILIGCSQQQPSATPDTNPHADLADEHLDVTHEIIELQNLQTEASGALAPGFSEGLTKSPGGGGAGAGTFPSEFKMENKSGGGDVGAQANPSDFKIENKSGGGGVPAGTVPSDFKIEKAPDKLPK